MFEIDIVEKMKNTSYVQYLFSSKIFAVYEIISKNWCFMLVPLISSCHFNLPPIYFSGI